MGKPTFPVPLDIDELSSLINGSGIPNLSVEAGDGSPHSWKIDFNRNDHITENISPPIEIIGGDQLLYTSDSEMKAQNFMYGIFYALYGGKSLGAISDLVTKLKSMNNKSYASLVLEIEHFKTDTTNDH